MTDSNPRAPRTVPDPLRERVTLEIREGVAWLTLDDGRANAIGSAFCDALGARLDEIETSAAHAVVLRGRPGFFSGGLDLKELPDLEPAELSAMMERFMRLMKRLFLFPRPIVAAADGHAIAGGMMIYLCADIRIATDRAGARFGLNEAVTGIPLLGGTAGLCQWGIPQPHHTEMILHGRLVDARGTLDRGITHALVADEAELDAHAAARAAALVDLSLPAYRLNKIILRQPAWDAAVAISDRFAGEAPDGNVFEQIRR